MQPREYLRRVATSWWNVVTALGAALAILSGVSGVHTPWWVWFALIIGGLLLAQYQTFQKAGARSSKVAATHLEPLMEAHPDSSAATPTESAAPGESAGAELQRRTVQTSPLQAARAKVEAESMELEPMWLQGQMYPYMYSPVVDATEKALATRVAITVQMPAKPEVGIGSSDQQAFEDAVADSSFERWILDETTVRRRPGFMHFWRPVDPTRSSIVTLKRPSAAMVPDGWTLDARAVLNLQLTQVPHPAGWMRLHLDSVIRPTDAILDRHRPLSLQEFFEQLYVMLSALLDEIGPAIVPRIIARPAHEPLSVGAVVIPSASMFNDYFPLGGRGWQRAEGSGDVPGAEWYPTARNEVADANRRAESIRKWMTKIVRDSGFVRGYERDIELLQPPTV
jgi:hypothetical protein